MVDREAWGKQYDGMNADDWASVLWSDEMSVCKQDGAVSMWVFRTASERFTQECIEPIDNGSKVTVMFWGCFCGREKGGFTTLFPNELATGKRGVTGTIILNVAYKEYLPDSLDSHPERVFMQDNAKVHTIPETMAWFAERGYTIMRWPKYSPDLNPIEMIWKRIKNMISTKHPELATMRGSDDSIKDAIVAAVIEAWEELDEEWLWRLSASMPDRVKAVIAAHGGYTHY